MSKVKTYFLIDFESVHDSGLSGSNKIASIFVKYCRDVNKLDNELEGLFPNYYETDLYPIVHDTVKKLTRRNEYK